VARLSLRRRLARLHPFVWIGAAAAGAALVAWPLGGWDTVELESTRIPQFAPGELVPGQQFSVRVESAELTDAHPDGFSDVPSGWTLLILELEVTNETGATEFSTYLGDAYSGIVTVDDGVVGWGTTSEDSDGREVSGSPFLAIDGTYLPDLQPELPSRVQLVFEVPEDTWAAEQQIVVGVVDRRPYESVLGVGTSYGFPALVGEVTMRVGGSS
jgi:hypothetical protein